MAELTDDQKKIKALEDQVATLTTAKTTLETQVKTLTTEKAQAVKDAADAADVVKELKDKLAEKESGVVKLPTVTVGKDTYELVGGAFTYAGQEVTIDVLKENSKLLAELLKEKVGNLRKIEK